MGEGAAGARSEIVSCSVGLAGDLDQQRPNPVLDLVAYLAYTVDWLARRVFEAPVLGLDETGGADVLDAPCRRSRPG